MGDEEESEVESAVGRESKGSDEGSFTETEEDSSVDDGISEAEDGVSAGEDGISEGVSEGMEGISGISTAGGKDGMASVEESDESAEEETIP